MKWANLLIIILFHESELQEYSFQLKHGLKTALESFSKWMEYWIYLPLSVCRLGGERGPEFAQAVASKILNHSFATELTWLGKYYLEFLEGDLSNGTCKSFGLFEALNDDDFLEQFLAFAESQASDIHKFPLVYDFVKYRIWSIVVHQQQIEGMFNKYDIKTEPNQKTSLQQARMLLTCSADKTQVTLKEIRREIREENERNEGKQERFGEEAAKSLLETCAIFKK